MDETMDEIEALIEQIRQRIDLHIDISGPQDEEVVCMLETALGINLPPSYRSFVKCYGNVGWDDFVLLGINSKYQLEAGAYPATILARSGFNLAASYVVIHYGADPDDIECLDISKSDSAGECPVVGYDSRHQTTWPLADNFGLYFQGLLADLLDEEV